MLKLIGAHGNNLKNITPNLPTGISVCVTGVSGSGKSTLINDTLYTISANQLNGAAHVPAPFESMRIPCVCLVIA